MEDMLEQEGELDIFHRQGMDVLQIARERHSELDAYFDEHPKVRAEEKSTLKGALRDLVLGLKRRKLGSRAEGGGSLAALRGQTEGFGIGAKIVIGMQGLGCLKMNEESDSVRKLRTQHARSERGQSSRAF